MRALSASVSDECFVDESLQPDKRTQLTKEKNWAVTHSQKLTSSSLPPSTLIQLNSTHYNAIQVNSKQFNQVASPWTPNQCHLSAFSAGVPPMRIVQHIQGLLQAIHLVSVPVCRTTGQRVCCPRRIPYERMSWPTRPKPSFRSSSARERRRGRVSFGCQCGNLEPMRVRR